MKNKRCLWVFVFILVMIEQGIKFVINSKYLEATLPILEPWLYFKPMFNRDYSWFNSMFQLGIGKWAHIVIVIILTIFIYLFYKFLNRQSDTPWLIDIAFIFILSGSICSLIDKIFWDGSLDYILIQKLFTFDLKDVYINVFIGLILLMFIINYKGIREANDRDVLEEFIAFIRGK